MNPSEQIRYSQSIIVNPNVRADASASSQSQYPQPNRRPELNFNPQALPFIPIHDKQPETSPSPIPAYFTKETAAAHRCNARAKKIPLLYGPLPLTGKEGLHATAATTVDDTDRYCHDLYGSIPRGRLGCPSPEVETFNRCGMCFELIRCEMGGLEGLQERCSCGIRPARSWTMQPQHGAW